jgi:pyruvate,water dikinase
VPLVDVGGALSHGAIVAREYGLPAMVNIKAATRLVHSGQIITANGATGEVWVE